MTPELKTDLTELLEIMDRTPIIWRQEKNHDTGANEGEMVGTLAMQVPERLAFRLKQHINVGPQ